MSVNPTGYANSSAPSFLPSTGGLVEGDIIQQNTGIIMSLKLTVPIVIAAGGGNPGGTATFMNLALEPVGAAPHASVALRMNFYDATGALIYVRDI